MSLVLSEMAQKLTQAPTKSAETSTLIAIVPPSETDQQITKHELESWGKEANFTAIDQYLTKLQNSKLNEEAYAWLCPYLCQHPFKISEATSRCEELVKQGILPPDHIWLNILKAVLYRRLDENIMFRSTLIKLPLSSMEDLLRLLELCIQQQKSILPENLRYKLFQILDRIHCASGCLAQSNHHFFETPEAYVTPDYSILINVGKFGRKLALFFLQPTPKNYPEFEIQIEQTNRDLRKYITERNKFITQYSIKKYTKITNQEPVKTSTITPTVPPVILSQAFETTFLQQSLCLETKSANVKIYGKTSLNVFLNRR